MGLFDGGIDFGQLSTGFATDPNAALPVPPQAFPPSMIDPQMLAKQFAARGVMPPPVDAAPPVAANPTVPSDGSVGAALTGTTVPLPQPRPVEAGPAAPKAEAGGNKFADALKGVKAPAGPELQRISSPSAPRPTTQIKGGDIIALLQSLGRAGGAGGSSYELPSTLGSALRR